MQKELDIPSELEEMSITSDTESIRTSSTIDSTMSKKGQRCAAKKVCNIKNRHFNFGEHCFILPCGCVFHMNCLWKMYYIINLKKKKDFLGLNHME